MAEEDTSIRIGIDTWKRLKDRKQHPNESFDDVVNDLLDRVEDAEQSEGNPSAAAMPS